VISRGKFEGKHSELTGKILGAFFQVHKDLGYGFSEKVYEGALAIVLAELGLTVVPQQHLNVYYHSQRIGEYIADLIVNDVVLLELKAAEKLSRIMLLNFLII
jgi:GxxExxY protein